MQSICKARNEALNSLLKWVQVSVALVCLLVAVGPLVAAAQEIPKDKEFNVYTSGGVDIFNRQLRMQFRDISVGSGQFPSNLLFIRRYDLYPFQHPAAYSAPFGAQSIHNFFLSAFCFPCDSGSGTNYMTVAAFDGTHSFSGSYAAWGSPRTWANRYGDGAEVTDNGTTFELRTKGGDRYVFSMAGASSSAPSCGGQCRVATYAEMANGETIIFSYENLTTSGFRLSRLTSVVNSRGYGLQFTFVNPSPTSGDTQTRNLIAGVSAFRTGCVSGVVNCSTGTLASVSYGYTAMGIDPATGYQNYRLTSFNDAQGKMVTYEYNGPGYRLSKAYFADSPSVKLFENSYTPATSNNEGMIAWQEDALSQQTTYSGGYDPGSPGGYVTTVVTPPDGNATTYHFQHRYAVDGTRHIHSQPTSIVTPLSRTLTYTYGTGLRLTSSMTPEGIKTEYTLDSRGNATQTTITPKTGATEAALISYAGFPSCSATNYRICNKPSYTIDARGARTDNDYDASNGQMTVTLAPANASDVRAVTRYNYSSFYPAPGVVAPSGATLASASLLTSRFECLTSTVTGTSINFGYVCPVGQRNATTYSYTASNSNTRTNFELEAVVADSDGLALRTCYKYDRAGNRIAETKPRAGLSICS